MMWRTHLLFGLDTLWVLAPFPNMVTSETIAPMAICVMLGSLLPDLDAQESKLTSLSIGGIRPFAPAALIANRAFGHRGLLHTPSGLLLAGGTALGIALVCGLAAGLAFWLGYLSHLMADACTLSGIPRGWSRTSARFHLLPPRWRFRTGSPAEDRLLLLLALPILVLFLGWLAA